MTAQTASPETTPATSSSSKATLRAWVTVAVLTGLLVLTVAFFAFTTTNTPSSINGTTVTSSSSQEGSGQN